MKGWKWKKRLLLDCLGCVQQEAPDAPVQNYDMEIGVRQVIIEGNATTNSKRKIIMLGSHQNN